MQNFPDTFAKGLAALLVLAIVVAVVYGAGLLILAITKAIEYLVGAC